MRSYNLIAFVLVALPLFAQTVSGLYADQAGTWDWHKQNIGRVTSAAFTGGRLKRAYVATEQNVVAALNLKLGDIAWRQVLAEDDKIDSLRMLSRFIVTLSHEGQHVRAWGPLDGILLWEHNTYTPAVLPVPGGPDMIPLSQDVDGDEVEDFMVLGRGQLQVRSGEDGLLLHTLNATALLEDTAVEGTGFYKMQLFEDTVYVAGLLAESDGYLVADIKPEASSMKQNKQQISGSKQKLSSNFMTLAASTGSPAIVGVTEDGTHFSVLVSDKGSFPSSVVLTPVKSVVPGVSTVEQVSLVEGTVFKATSDGEDILLQLDGNVIKPFFQQQSGKSVVSKGLTVGGKDAPAQQVFGMMTTGADGTAVAKVYDVAAPSEPLLEEMVPAMEVSLRGGISEVFLNSYARKNGTFGYRMLLVCDDASLALVQQGEVVWDREEALASITEVGWVDPPPNEHGIEIKALNMTEIEAQLYQQWLHFKVRMKIATADETAELVMIRRSNGDKLLNEWDSQGFRKQLVVLTTSGTVVALHNGDGRTLWRVFPGGLPAKTMIMSKQPPDEDLHPEVMLLGSTAEGYTRSVTINAWTGEVVSNQTFQFKLSQVIQLPKLDSQGNRVILLVDDQQQVHLITAGDESLDLTRDALETLYFYEVAHSEGSITGYTPGPQIPPVGGAIASFNCMPLWQSHFPDPILEVAGRRPDEKIYAQARILGDRSTLYKYLNPNTIFVATGSESSAHAMESSVTAHLVDTVTGRMLYRVRHAGAQAPVRAVFAENWVVYQYWNVIAHRNEVSVLEIYDDDAAQSESGIFKAAVLGAVGLSDTTTGVSSMAAPMVRVLGQSYFFSMGVKTMAVTNTQAGVTSKNVLLGTQTDQILAMEKRFLDPRRPTKPTQVDKEEGLIPYNPLLPIIPHHFITTNMQVARLKGISTHPARLESTSLTLGYGLDLFYTRVMPSKMYDTLDDYEFSYALLLLTIITLLIATVVVGILVQRKDLDHKWQ